MPILFPHASRASCIGKRTVLSESHPHLKKERQRENRELKLTNTHPISRRTRTENETASLLSFSFVHLPRLSRKTEFHSTFFNFFSGLVKYVCQYLEKEQHDKQKCASFGINIVRYCVVDKIHTCISRIHSPRLDTVGHTWPAWHRRSRTVAQPRRSWVGYDFPRRRRKHRSWDDYRAFGPFLSIERVTDVCAHIFPNKTMFLFTGI